MMRWLSDYAVACAVATAALVLVFIGGVAAGNWAGPGANTAAAQNYAHGLQGEWEAETELKIGNVMRTCAATTDALKNQIADLQRQVIATGRAGDLQRHDDAVGYSERITGLEQILAGHGIDPVVPVSR